MNWKRDLETYLPYFFAILSFFLLQTSFFTLNHRIMLDGFNLIVSLVLYSPVVLALFFKNKLARAVFLVIGFLLVLASFYASMFTCFDTCPYGVNIKLFNMLFFSALYFNLAGLIWLAFRNGIIKYVAITPFTLILSNETKEFRILSTSTWVSLKTS